MTKISLQITKEQYEKILSIAKKRDRSLSFIVREAIDKLKPKNVKK